MKNFTPIQNEIINTCKVIGIDSLGLYVFLLSKPPNWNFSARRIALESGCSYDKVLRLLKILEASGNLTRVKTSSGRTNYKLKDVRNLPRWEFPTVAISHGGQEHTVSKNIAYNKNIDYNKNIIISSQEIVPDKPLAVTKVKAVKVTKIKKEIELTSEVKDITSVILFFYQTMSPAVKPVFSTTNRKTVDNLLVSYGLRDIIESIKKAKSLLGQPYKPQVATLTALAMKYEVIRAGMQSGIHPTQRV